MSMPGFVPTAIFAPRSHAEAAEQLRAHLMARAPACPGQRPLPRRGRATAVVPAGLVDIRREAPELVALSSPTWSEPELRFLVRPEMAARLGAAARALPSDLRLGFWEGLRPVTVQRSLWDSGLAFLRASY